MLDDFEDLGKEALLGVYVETCLLVGIVLNTLFLSVLLYQTRKHLSTATILFIFNILFSNALFVASFVCLFSDMLAGISYGSVDESPTTTDAALVFEELGSRDFVFFSSKWISSWSDSSTGPCARSHQQIYVGKSHKALAKMCNYCVFTGLAIPRCHSCPFFRLQYSAITNLDQLITKVGSALLLCNATVPNCQTSLK
uniref:G-protein coupled receptors family 1 profile domain-containing protein n=1 Tax=Ditylenchus dipsaci TaxID=166011 RepID=A0A915D4I1_9BILA